MTAEQMQLRGQRLAALVTDGFEHIELSTPVSALEQAGATVDLIVFEGATTETGEQNNRDPNSTATTRLAAADPQHYAGLLLPGGEQSADRLRLEPRAVAFVQAFIAAGKPIGASGYGSWILISAEEVRGRQLTSAPELRADLEQAGAHWVDRGVVADDTLITSRAHEDLPAFSQALIAALASRRDETAMHSEAPNASFATGTGHAAIGTDAAALAGNALGNNAYPEGNTYPQEPEASQLNEHEPGERKLR